MVCEKGILFYDKMYSYKQKGNFYMKKRLLPLFAVPLLAIGLGSCTSRAGFNADKLFYSPTPLKILKNSSTYTYGSGKSLEASTSKGLIVVSDTHPTTSVTTYSLIDLKDKNKVVYSGKQDIIVESIGGLTSSNGLEFFILVDHKLSEGTSGTWVCDVVTLIDSNFNVLLDAQYSFNDYGFSFIGNEVLFNVDNDFYYFSSSTKLTLLNEGLVSKVLSASNVYFFESQVHILSSSGYLALDLASGQIMASYTPRSVSSVEEKVYALNEKQILLQKKRTLPATADDFDYVSGTIKYKLTHELFNLTNRDSKTIEFNFVIDGYQVMVSNYFRNLIGIADPFVFGTATKIEDKFTLNSHYIFLSSDGTLVSDEMHINGIQIAKNRFVVPSDPSGNEYAIIDNQFKTKAKINAVAHANLLFVHDGYSYWNNGIILEGNGKVTHNADFKLRAPDLGYGQAVSSKGSFLQAENQELTLYTLDGKKGIAKEELVTKNMPSVSHNFLEIGLYFTNQGNIMNIENSSIGKIADPLDTVVITPFFNSNDALINPNYKGYIMNVYNVTSNSGVVYYFY